VDRFVIVVFGEVFDPAYGSTREFDLPVVSGLDGLFGGVNTVWTAGS
jgi:hypothetical protein